MSEPKTVAILGASKDRAKFGNKSVRAHLAAGWRVFPVHPNESTVEGERAYASLAEVPRPLDRISVYLPPPVTLKALPAIAAAGAAEVYFNPGAADAAVLAEARRLQIPALDACSIVALGFSSAMFP
jgi:predicted CoA-binding protein